MAWSSEPGSVSYARSCLKQAVLGTVSNYMTCNRSHGTDLPLGTLGFPGVRLGHDGGWEHWEGRVIS